MSIATYIEKKGGTGTLTCPVLADLAERCDCSTATLYMISLGHKKAGAGLARRIEVGTRGEATCHELRPDYFGPAPSRKRAA